MREREKRRRFPLGPELPERIRRGRAGDVPRIDRPSDHVERRRDRANGFDVLRVHEPYEVTGREVVELVRPRMEVFAHKTVI